MRQDLIINLFSANSQNGQAHSNNSLNTERKVKQEKLTFFETHHSAKLFFNDCLFDPF